MKRLGFVFVMMVVLGAVSTPSMAESCTEWAFQRSRVHGNVYRNGWYNGGGYYYGRGGYYDGYGYGWYGRGNCHDSYPSGSLLSGLFGLPTYNDEQYWAYQNRILDLGEKGLNRQGGDQPYVKDQKLLSEANQRGKIQKLEERIAELEKILAGKSGK